MRKKGIQLNQAFGAVLTLVLVAVLVIVAIVIFVTLATSFAGTDSVSVVNETGINGTNGAILAGGLTCGFTTASIVEVNNGSNAINTGNYSFTATTALINDTAGEFNNTLWNVTYDYLWGTEACTASENITDEFGNYTSLIGLVGTIIFLGLVIGILVAAFAFSGRKEV